ncbi:MAG TPA: hypothetical protein VGL61_36550 [Kofleriaceae bacterium]|jgi:hypothetical protein
MRALLVLSIPLAACTVAKAQVDATDMCISYSDVAIKGVAAGTTTLDHVFNYNKLALIQAFAKSVSNLQFISITAHATSGITSFDFVEAAHVTVASGDPTSLLPTIDVYDCDGDCVPDGSSLTVPSTFQSSAIDYIDTGSIVADLEISGALPVDGWTMDVDFCFSGDLTYETGL